MDKFSYKFIDFGLDFQLITLDYLYMSKIFQLPFANIVKISKRIVKLSERNVKFSRHCEQFGKITWQSIIILINNLTKSNHLLNNFHYICNL